MMRAWRGGRSLYAARELRAVYETNGPFMSEAALDRVEVAKALDRLPEEKRTRP
jgi:hypothetical protein